MCIAYLRITTTAIVMIGLALSSAISQEIDLPSQPGFDFPDEYRPDGIRTENFIYKPSLEISAGHTDDIRRDGDAPVKDLFTEITPRLKIESDWDRNEVFVDLRGSKIIYRDNSPENETSYDAFTAVTLDLSEDTTLDLEAQYVFEQEPRDDPETPEGTDERPFEQKIIGSAELSHSFGKFELALKGTIDDRVKEKDPFDTGAAVDVDNRDYTRYDTRLRGTYEISEKLAVFAEAAYNNWSFEQKVDDDNLRRGSHGYGAFAGFEARLGKSVEAQAAIGYRHQNFEEATFADLNYVTMDAWIKWDITGSTALTLSTTTDFEESTISETSAILSREVSLRLDHQPVENVNVFGEATYVFEDFMSTADRDDTYIGRVGVDYALNKEVMIKALYEHERLSSDFPEDNFTENKFLVGLKLSK